MQPVRSSLIEDGQEVSVYESDLDSKRRVVTIFFSAVVTFNAGMVVHVQAYACKFLGQTIEDIKITPNWLIADRS